MFYCNIKQFQTATVKLETYMYMLLLLLPMIGQEWLMR